MTFNTSKLEPIFSRNFLVDFENEILNELCCKITKKYFHFNINEYEDKVIPLSTLDKLINNKKILNVIVNLYNRTGISIIYLEDVILLKIKGLNLNCESDDIIKI